MRIILCAVLLFATCWLLSFPAMAAPLERRPMFGASIAAKIPDDVRRAQNVPAGQGLLVDKVLPGLSAEAGGFLAGDILFTLDGEPLDNVQQLQAGMRVRHVGDHVDVGFLRKGERKSASVVLRGLPYETSDTFDIVYGDVAAGDGVRRTIVTKPRDGRRHPAVVLIGGIGCYSVDQPFNPEDAYRMLLGSFTRRGFVTLRVEKSGMGDSTGEACATVDLDTEVDGLVAGLRQLKAQPYVDPSRVFIFGHSIGGVTGPMVATQEPVRGLLMLETTGLSWFEYELINLRRQLVLGHTKPTEIGATMLDKEWCMHHLLIEREPRNAILKVRPSCGGHMDYPASDAYLQQVASQNLEGLWEKLDGTDVGVIYGAADFITGAAESKAIVDAVNAARPGKGQYIEIADMDHYLTKVASQADSLAAIRANKPQVLHPRLEKITGEWLSKVACGAARGC